MRAFSFRKFNGCSLFSIDDTMNEGNLVKEAEFMSTRKEMSNAYKERKPCGGVYTITNTVNGRYSF